MAGDSPLRLMLDRTALVDNWRWLAAQSGAESCGAAIKANGYGLGAAAVVQHLATAGCQDFFVATWAEARALGAMPHGSALSVLHGVRAEDMALATQSAARPTLNTLGQIPRWRETRLPCDVMVDTGMNRLGISVGDVENGALDGLNIITLMSHLACADEDSAMNAAQRHAFASLSGKTKAQRMSLANSAGIALGRDYAFDLTRPGLSLYGGIVRPEMALHIKQVVYPQTQILQRRQVRAGEPVGYNATFRAPRDMEIATLNLGYADGYLRPFSAPHGKQGGSAEKGQLSLIGRVSMDMIALNVDAMPALAEGDWVCMDYALPEAARISGLSQYELLTGLGARFDRIWM